MADAVTPTIRTFQVFPDVPAPLLPLLELAHNLWWVWNPDAVELFRRLDRKLWDDVYHNPVKLLGVIAQSKLATAASDDGFLAHMNRVYTAYKAHIDQTGWFAESARRKERIARRLFLGRVRPARIAADLFRRPGNSRGGPSQERQRTGAAAPGRRAALSQRLFPAVFVGRRMAAGGVSGAGFLQSADSAGSLYRRLLRADSRGYAGQRGLLQSLEGAGRTHPALSDGHQSAGKFAGRSGDHQQTVRRRHRDAHQAGDRAGHRRGARRWPR